MVASVVATSIVSGVTFDETTPFSVTLNGTGTKRAVIICACGRRGALASLASLLLDGVAADSLTDQVVTADGGQSVVISIGVWLDVNHPGTGAFDVTPNWNAISKHLYIVTEVKDALQNASTILSAFQTDFATAVAFDVAETLGADLTGESGKLGIIVYAAADSSFMTGPAVTDTNANLDVLGNDSDGDSSLKVGYGYDNSIALSPQNISFDWKHTRSATVVDSLAAIMFSVDGVAGGAPVVLVQGQVTPAGVLTRQIIFGSSLTGSLSPSGGVTKRISKDFLGTLTTAGSITKQTAKTFAASLTPSSTLTAVIVFLRTVTGSLSPSSSVTKLISKLFAGNVAPSGGIAKQTQKSVTGNVDPSASVTKETSKSPGGSVTPSGTVDELFVTNQAASGILAIAGSIISQFIAAPGPSLGKAFRRMLSAVGSLRHRR